MILDVLDYNDKYVLIIKHTNEDYVFFDTLDIKLQKILHTTIRLYCYNTNANIDVNYIKNKLYSKYLHTINEDIKKLLENIDYIKYIYSENRLNWFRNIIEEFDNYEKLKKEAEKIYEKEKEKIINTFYPADDKGNYFLSHDATDYNYYQKDELLTKIEKRLADENITIDNIILNLKNHKSLDQEL